MKTFQEAFETVVQVLPESHMRDPEKRRAAEARASDQAERARGLADEAHAHQHLSAVLDTIPDSTCCMHHGLHAAFQLGLRVGMEMERQDLPGGFPMVDERNSNGDD